MSAGFQFAQPYFLVGSSILIITGWFIHTILKKNIFLRYSLVSRFVKKFDHSMGRTPRYVDIFIQRLMFFLLACASGMPQFIDHYSKMHVEGIDIIIALDASASMACFDDIRDQRDRFSVAKSEAIRFAHNRVDDQIGLVLFGKEAVSRCPLTHDKAIIAEIIQNTELGVVNADGTVLSIGLMMALKRLQSSQSKSKIVILLTDGEPTREIDAAPEKAIELAKKLGIKVYTIGIGNESGCYMNHPFFGITSIKFDVNKALLSRIAHETGGEFFMAEDAAQMRRIYEKINSLEKTTKQAPLYTHHTNIGHYFLWIVVILCLVRSILFNGIWKIIA